LVGKLPETPAAIIKNQKEQLSINTSPFLSYDPPEIGYKIYILELFTDYNFSLSGPVIELAKYELSNGPNHRKLHRRELKYELG
jgi:hypothetical protein